MGTPFQEHVKAAYDYAHEIAQLEKVHERRRAEAPSDPRQATLSGAGLGVLLGAGLGLAAAYGRIPVDPARAAMVGAGGGAALGAGLGFANAMKRNQQLEQSHMLATLPPGEKADFLRSLARKAEIESRDQREWHRARYQAQRADLRRVYL